MRNIYISQPVMDAQELRALEEPIDSGWITQGPKVGEFEKHFSAFHHLKHSLAVTSCTTGLHLILHALGIGPSDEVIVPAFSWVASANVVEMVGATPVFVDVDMETYNIATEQVGQKITPNTKAIIVVHLFGLCADIDAIKANIPKHVHIIEDAACAAGATYKSTFAGGLGTAASFSFHPRKIITTGEGGMLTTNDEALASQLHILRNHGASISEEQRHNGPKPYILPEFNTLGFNYRMTDLQGAIGCVQMRRLQSLLRERREKATFYLQELNGLDWLQLPHIPSYAEHSWQSFVTLVKPECGKNRNELMEQLQQKGIATRPGTHAIHSLDYYRKKYKLSKNDFPNAQCLNDFSMAIPLHNKMSVPDYNYVVQAIKELEA